MKARAALPLKVTLLYRGAESDIPSTGYTIV